MNLLLDLGNTRLKWALQRADAPLHVESLSWEDAQFDERLKQDLQAGSIEDVCAVSVVDEARRSCVEAVLGHALAESAAWFVSSPRACGVRNAYTEPQRLGGDRFLALIAAFADALAPCVIAGCGTALTLDALASDGRHLGGLIVPGPALMQKSLADVAPRVGPHAAGNIVASADNTSDALTSGSWHACAALVERYFGGQSERLGPACRLLLSGGDAVAMSHLLAVPHRHFPDAVLKGLAYWARERRDS